MNESSTVDLEHSIQSRLKKAGLSDSASQKITADILQEFKLFLKKPVVLKSLPTSPKPANTGLPANWKVTNVGITQDQQKGSVSQQNNQWTLKGGGADIIGKSDQFLFVHQPITLDVEMVLSVENFDSAELFAKGGIMFRANTDPAAAFAMLYQMPNKSLVLLARQNPNAEASVISLKDNPGGSLKWLKLTRQGTQLTAFCSSDKQNWQNIASLVLDFGASFEVGIAVTSHSVNTLATANFAGVSLVNLVATTTQGNTVPISTTSVSPVVQERAVRAKVLWPQLSDGHEVYDPNTGAFVNRKMRIMIADNGLTVTDADYQTFLPANSMIRYRINNGPLFEDSLNISFDNAFAGLQVSIGKVWFDKGNLSTPILVLTQEVVLGGTVAS